MSDGKVALVTGGSRGIGAAIARALGSAGAHVLVSALDLEACQAVAREVQRGGGSATAFQLDVSSAEGIRRGLERAHAIDPRSQAIDWLVNNAGIVHSAPLLAADNESAHERLFAVNFHGPRRLIEALAPGMRARNFGRIVNVASSAGLRGYRYVSVYCASKHALVGYSRAAALDLAQSGVTLHCVCPHYVDSPMTDRNVERMRQKTGKSADELRAFLASQNPGGKLVAPEDVARAVLDLLQGGSNGRIVELDGGPPRVVEELSP